jgi:predicted DNA-binding transcriptional regulator AlpA
VTFVGQRAAAGGLGRDAMDITDSYLLRPPEVIEMLGVSRSWLYEAAKPGRIPCVRLGGPEGPLRFRATELDACVEGSRVPRGEPAADVSVAPEPGAIRRRRRASPHAPAVEQLRLIAQSDR